ncbi:MAG: lyase family protein [Gammaproteobacteria bacterium]
MKTEIGSSTMPHKVNPIDFENVRPIDREGLHAFLDTLSIREAEKNRLRPMTPRPYTGNAEAQARAI